MAYIGASPPATALTASDIADGIISEAKMANDAISLAELKAGTDGELISWDASANPVAIGAGTSGHFLKSQGAGSVPVFAAAGGDAVKLASGTVSSGTSSVVIDGYFSSTYENFEILLNNFVPSAENTLRWRFNASGSALTASSYRMGFNNMSFQSGSSGIGAGYSWDIDYAKFNVEVTGTLVNRGMSARMWLPQMAQTSPAIYPTCQMSCTTGHTTVYRHATGTIVYAASAGTAMSGISIYMASGNINSGEWVVYGIKS